MKITSLSWPSALCFNVKATEAQLRSAAEFAWVYQSRPQGRVYAAS